MMDRNSRIKNLLYKYLTQTINIEEYKELANLCSQSEVDELTQLFDQLELYELQWHIPELEFDQDRILQAVQDEISNKTRKKFTIPFWIKIGLAAASCILLVFSYNFFVMHRSSQNITALK